MGKQSFVQGAFILVIASIIVKAMGFCYQIIIIRLIGTEGIGIFNMVYPIYTAAIVMTTAGLPLALTKFVAEELARNKKQMAEQILGMAVFVLTVLSTCGAFLLIISSPFLIRKIYADPRVIPAFLILIPTILLIAIASAIRGYFQGTQDMRPTAFTQLVEQVIRFTSGVVLVYLLYPAGLTWAVVGLASAIFLSELGGLLFLLHLYRKSPRTQQLLVRPTFPIVKKLLCFGIPVTITRIVVTLVSAVEASLIPYQLIKAGNTLSEAASFYGELTGVAFTLLMIPSTLSFSLSTTLVPAISEALSKNQRVLLGKRTADAVGITILAGVPWAIILFCWGSSYAELLFKVSQAGEILRILALGSVFLYLSQTTSGILQGIGYVKMNFTTTLIGGLLRLGGIYYLGSRPLLGPTTVAAAYVISFVSIALLNLLIIKIKTGLLLEGGFLIRLLLSALLFYVLLQWISPYVTHNLLLLFLVTVGLIIIFFFTLLVTGDKYSALFLQQLLKLVKKYFPPGS